MSGWLGRPRLRLFLLGCLKPLFLAAGLMAYAAIRLIEPWKRLRFGLLGYERIGHLALNTEVFLRRRAADRLKDKVLPILLSGPPANQQLFKMIRRSVNATDLPWARRIYFHGLLPLIEGSRFHEQLGFNGNEYDAFTAAGPQLSFTTEESARGERLLAAMGLPPGQPFVCFHARDKSYLDRTQTYRSRDQWSYHDYRDCDIDRYLPAARRLAERGLFALRMGSVVEKPIVAGHPRVIDYATRFRSDFADIYLAAHCKFFLGNTAGLGCVPPIFNIPVALANFAPLGYATWRAGDLFIPKTYHDGEGRPILYSRIVAMNATMWLSAAQFASAGIEVRENSAEDISDLAEEINSRIDGRWRPEPDDEELQRKFRALFPERHPINGFPARIGSGFLRRHRDLLSPP